MRPSEKDVGRKGFEESGDVFWIFRTLKGMRFDHSDRYGCSSNDELASLLKRRVAHGVYWRLMSATVPYSIYERTFRINEWDSMAMANGRRWSEVKERIRQGRSVVAQVSRLPNLHKGALYKLLRKISNAQNF
jgi:hypothetical protein